MVKKNYLEPSDQMALSRPMELLEREKFMEIFGKTFSNLGVTRENSLRIKVSQGHHGAFAFFMES